MLSILWHDFESAGYTTLIPLDWLYLDGARKEAFHQVRGPREGKYKAQCDIILSGSIADFDYEPYEKFNETQGMFIGVMRVKFTSPSRDRVVQVLWKKKGDDLFKPSSTTATFVADVSNFESCVTESSRHTSEERQKRLATAVKKPLRTQVMTTAFLRNPDVVAEVLFRANGKCGRCNKPAPFKRRDNGTPYLEVHHKKRLAEDGEDTVGNAIALCPNCHREAHYG